MRFSSHQRLHGVMEKEENKLKERIKKLETVLEKIAKRGCFIIPEDFDGLTCKGQIDKRYWCTTCLAKEALV